MKTRVFITLLSVIVSMAFLCSFNNRAHDYTVNDIGGYIVYEGIKSEQGIIEFVGGSVAALGGEFVVKGIGIYLGAAGSNPLGWVIGGACAIL